MKNIFLLIISLVPFMAKAQSPQIDLVQFSSGYELPVDINNCGDNRLFVGELGGKIWICKADGSKGKLFLDISSKVYDQQFVKGFMGFTFHPDYSDNGYFYVYYLNKQKNTVISRFSVSPTNPNKALASSEKKLLTIKQTYGGSHFGGCLKFGPDGYLYIGMGDGDVEGDSSNTAQKHNLLFGKMLRINVDSGLTYSIPPDNPFIGTPGYRKEIWALGLRNPWRYTFDDLTDDLWLSDVGEDSLEEINFQPNGDAGGENYGWRCYEGSGEFNTVGCGAIGNYTFPVAEYSHADSDCAVMGGYVYRGSLYPNMYGKYFCCDYCTGKFRMVYNDGSWHINLLGQFTGGTYVSFGKDRNKELYVVSQEEGKIFHLVDGSSPVSHRDFTISANDSKLMIYPNPAHGSFMITYNSPEQKEIKIKVLNMEGKPIGEYTRILKNGQNQFQIDAPLISGQYVVMIQSEEVIETRKLVVE